MYLCIDIDTSVGVSIVDYDGENDITVASDWQHCLVFSLRLTNASGSALEAAWDLSVANGLVRMDDINDIVFSL